MMIIRIAYLASHIDALRDAIEIDEVDVIGYTCWGPIDIISVGTGEMKNATVLYMWIKMIRVWEH